MVVSVDKTTQQVTLISTYTQNDLLVVQATQPTTTTTTQTTQSTQTTSETVPLTSVEVTSVVQFIESSPDVPVTGIKTILSAEKTTTLFGNQVVTIGAITNKNVKIEVEASFNPVTGTVTLNDFLVVEQAQTPTNTTTEFTVDLITGAKIT